MVKWRYSGVRLISPSYIFFEQILFQNLEPKYCQFVFLFLFHTIFHCFTWRAIVVLYQFKKLKNFLSIKNNSIRILCSYVNSFNDFCSFILNTIKLNWDFISNQFEKLFRNEVITVICNVKLNNGWLTLFFHIIYGTSSLRPKSTAQMLFTNTIEIIPKIYQICGVLTKMLVSGYFSNRSSHKLQMQQF